MATRPKRRPDAWTVKRATGQVVTRELSDRGDAGTVLGTVMRHEREGMYGFGLGDRVYYVGVAPDGVEVTGRGRTLADLDNLGQGVDTQREAAQALWRYAEPLNVTVEWKEMIYGSWAYSGWVRERGMALGVTRYPNSEPAWIVDYAGGASGMPAFANGEGSRVTRPRFVTRAQHVLLEAAVDSAGIRTQGDVLYDPATAARVAAAYDASEAAASA